MKKILVIFVAFLMMASIAMAAKPTKCTTIQDGGLTDVNGDPITLGYDKWGYNYQAHMFNGWYDNYDRAGEIATSGDRLMMKWNDAWLSNKDCSSDGKLDRHYGLTSYIGSGAWLTNHQSGSYVGVGTDYWDVTGTYNINVEYQGVNYPETLVLTQSGTAITGVSLDTIPAGSYFTVYDGSVIGTDINIYANKGSLVIHMVGTIAEDGTMSGTWADELPGTRTGTWETTTGGASGFQTCYWSDFVKIVALPELNTPCENPIWGEFCIIQEVYTDPCAGYEGLLFKDMNIGPGFGAWS